MRVAPTRPLVRRSTLRATPSDGELLANPILIIGPPRSGTSLLLRILAEHRDLAFLTEPRTIWRYGNERRSDVLRPGDARPEVVRHVRRAFANAVRTQARRRLVEKTPSNALRLGFVERIFPDCRFLFIQREPVETILSIRDGWLTRTRDVRTLRPDRAWRVWREARLRAIPFYAAEGMRRLAPRPLSRWSGPPLWGPRLPGLAALARELDPLEIAFLQWRACVETATRYGRRLPPDRFRALRLEALSPPEIERLLGFCGLERDPAVLARFEREYDPGLTAHRTAKAEPADIERIRYWTDELG